MPEHSHIFGFGSAWERCEVCAKNPYEIIAERDALLEALRELVNTNDDPFRRYRAIREARAVIRKVEQG